MTRAELAQAYFERQLERFIDTKRRENERTKAVHGLGLQAPSDTEADDTSFDERIVDAKDYAGWDERDAEQEELRQRATSCTTAALLWDAYPGVVAKPVDELDELEDRIKRAIDESAKSLIATLNELKRDLGKTNAKIAKLKKRIKKLRKRP